jgi:hypothetical protein
MFPICLLSVAEFLATLCVRVDGVLDQAQRVYRGQRGLVQRERADMIIDDNDPRPANGLGNVLPTPESRLNALEIVQGRLRPNANAQGE